MTRLKRYESVEMMARHLKKVYPTASKKFCYRKAKRDFKMLSALNKAEFKIKRGK